MGKKNDASRIEFPLKGIDGNLAYSDEAVWAYYNLATTNFDFLTTDSIEGEAQKINAAIAALVTNQTQSEEIKVIVSASALDVEKWAQDWDKKVSPWDPTDGYREWVLDMREHLGESYYTQKEVYLAVKVGNRASYRNTQSPSTTTKGDITQGVKSALDALVRTVGRSIGVSDYEISDTERQYWTTKASETTRILASGNLRATPSTSDTIARLFKRPLYPSMPEPTLPVENQKRWGKGDLAILKTGYIDAKKRKFVRIVQQDDFGNDMEGYRATLSVAKFPEEYDFPHAPAWMHYAAMLGQHFDMISHITLHPTQKVKKMVGNKIKEINDEADNAAQAGMVPRTIEERHAVAKNLEFELSNSREPFAYARHRIVVTAESEEQLRTRVATLIQHYANQEIVLQWTTGDQYDLLRESTPASPVYSNAFLQQQNLSVISGGMPTANASVGD